jgi:hypothetical protein
VRGRFVIFVAGAVYWLVGVRPGVAGPGRT